MGNDSSNNSMFKNVWRRFQERPLFYTGVIGLTGVVSAGLYGLKTRKMPLSLYLINLRLSAQGTFVVIMTGGVVYALAKQLFKEDKAQLETTDRKLKR